MGSTVAEAQKKVDEKVTLKRGYRMVWQGDFENKERAEKRLAQVVPISLLLIFLLLFSMFGNLRDAGLVFLNVPFAIVGGIFALLITGTDFSISAGIGFIALFGICIQSGIILITIFKENLHKLKDEDYFSLYNAIKLGVNTDDQTCGDDSINGSSWAYYLQPFRMALVQKVQDHWHGL